MIIALGDTFPSADFFTTDARTLRVEVNLLLGQPASLIARKIAASPLESNGANIGEPFTAETQGQRSLETPLPTAGIHSRPVGTSENSVQAKRPQDSKAFRLRDFFARRIARYSHRTHLIAARACV